MTTTETTTASTDIDTLVTAAIEQVERGDIALKDLLKALSPEAEAQPVPSEVPLPAEITDEEHVALDRVGEVYGSVVPAERRMLEPAEVHTLVEERLTLDTIEKMSKRRKEDIRTIIFNHLDVEVEESGIDLEAPRDKRGHYVVEGQVIGQSDTPKKFKREVRESSPSISESALKALSEDPDVPDFTHEDYLAMTTQTRVVDENKIMLALKNKPELIHAISKAVTPGGKTAALTVRNA